MNDATTDSHEWDPLAGESDDGVITVFNAFKAADPGGDRVARLMRRTLDQLYDGQRTGRFSWAQLMKTERTHFGTLFEINLRHEFDDVIDEGNLLDYCVRGLDVDCKFSQKMFGWMIPPEGIGQILLVGFVDDAASEFALGVVRASTDHVRSTTNRDAKTQLNPLGRSAVQWLHRPGDLPPNVLLQCSDDDREAILSKRSGQQRINELFRRIQHVRIGRGVVATVARQDDYMKRVRANGGARTALRPEGIVILSGDYLNHARVARELGLPVPAPGELVSARLVLADEADSRSTDVGGASWRLAEPEDALVPAPDVPNSRAN